ncbi:MAG: hypothetical protein M3Z46_02265 [Actinomycetota bacterium]|nr:hypothetical protein [Actinomycetota bacterium]
MPNLNTIPRTAVEQWLGVVRLPLNAAAAVTHHSEDESWPPALAFDAFEVRVKSAAAAVLHDDQLAEAAELGEQRIARLRDAIALESAAEQKRAQADQQLAQRREQAEDRADHAKEKAQELKEQLEAQESAAKRRVREQTAAKERELDEVNDRSQELIDERSRVAEQKRLQAERAALAERKKAVSAKSRALKLDKATEATRQRRKAGS